MRKDIILFVTIFSILVLIAGGTYAYWTWSSSSNKSVGFNTAGSIEPYIEYNAGTSHFVGDFQPSTNYCGGVYNTISFNKTSDAREMVLVASIKMDVNSIETNISSSNNVYWVVIKGEHSSCGGNINSLPVVAYGTFKGKTSGSTLTLTSNSRVLTSAEKYTIYIWIDSSGSNSSLSGQTLDVNIWTQIDQIAAWYGDANLDGFVDTNDTTLIQGHINGTLLTGQALRNADVNADGDIDSDDITIITNYILGTVTSLPLNPYIG